MLRKLARSLLWLDDRCFELRHGISTGGRIRPGSLGFIHPEAEAFSTPYEGVRILTLRLAFRSLANLDRDNRLRHFLDVGCGKGRACCYAAITNRFDSVAGFDLSPQLIEQARENARRLRSPSMSFDVADARTLTIAPKPTVLFLFNPFGPSVLGEFVANNKESFQESGSVLIYANDRHRDVLKQAGLTECHPRLHRRSTSFWRVAG